MERQTEHHIEHEITQPSSIFQSHQELNVYLSLHNAEGKQSHKESKKIRLLQQ